MAAGRILRHSGAGAGILHRRPHTIPANETIVFLRVEILTHLAFSIDFDNPARFSVPVLLTQILSTLV